MVSACYWRGRLCFGRGRDKGFVLYISLFFAGVRVVGVCVLVYARTHTQTTRVLDVSPGVRLTVSHFGEHKRLHLESSKQNYYIVSLRAIIKAIFTSTTTTQFVKNSNKESVRLQIIREIKPRELQIAQNQFTFNIVHKK